MSITSITNATVSGAITVGNIDKIAHQINRDILKNSVPAFTVILSRKGAISVCKEQDIITDVKGQAVRSRSVSVSLDWLATTPVDEILKNIIKAMGKVRELDGGEKLDKFELKESIKKSLNAGIDNMIKKQTRCLEVIKKEDSDSKAKAKAKKSEKTEKITEKLREFKLTDAQIAEVLAIVNSKVKKA